MTTETSTSDEDTIGAYVAILPDEQIQVLAAFAEVIEPEDPNPPVEALRERLIWELETGSLAFSDFQNWVKALEVN